MALASRFGTHSPSIRSAYPLSDDQIYRVAPSIFAVDPHESRSERYRYISTATVLATLRAEGFQPFMAAQTRVHDASRREFTKHMLRLRRVGQINSAQANEIILLNAHDGTGLWQILAGMFRFVCQNGLVLGDVNMDIRIRHSGKDVSDAIIEGAYTVVNGFDRIAAQREAMEATVLNRGESLAFAQAALTVRYGEDASTLQPEQVLVPRRYDDQGSDLWTTFNRVQENLVRGGLNGRSKVGKSRQTRAVTGIGADITLNRALWTLAESMRALKAA